MSAAYASMLITKWWHNRDVQTKRLYNSIVESSRYFRLFVTALESSAEMLGENNARPLLKSVQNPEILINNMSVNMSDYFINTFSMKRKSYF